MTSWLPSSIQKRLLRYAINYIGILDEQAIDLDNLDISWGRKSTVEFRNVGLNVERLSALARLPPNVRLETAKILLLRATLPANLYGISVEADGIEVVARLEEEQDDVQKQHGGYSRTSGSNQSPSHRKTTRRLRSPSRGRLEEGGVPTAADLARSFLAEEPIEERRELEATVAANARDLEQSDVSESSDGSGVETGTGAGPGLPTFLANYLQGIMDSFEASVENIHVTLRTETLGSTGSATPVGLALKVGTVHIPSKHAESQAREVKVEQISVDLHAKQAVLLELSQLPSPTSPAASRSSHHRPQSVSSSRNCPPEMKNSRAAATSMYHSLGGDMSGHDLPAASADIRASAISDDLERFADAGEDGEHLAYSVSSDSGIQPGDDNISWTSRRSRSEVPAENLWGATSQEDLPDSFLISTGRPLRDSRSSKHSSHHQSSPERSCRAVSPYDRHLQGPGSWPRPERSPQSVRPSPGSWPAPDQSQQSFYHPATPRPGPVEDDATDNKLAAMDASIAEPVAPPSPGVQSNAQQEPGSDLAESRFFSHDEAESIYMSAMATDPNSPMPGAWGTDYLARESHHSPELSHPQATDPIEPIPEAAAPYHPRPLPNDPAPSRPTSEAATPRAQSPSSVSSSTLSRNVLQLVYIDVVTATIGLPPSVHTKLPLEWEPQNHDAPTMSRMGIPGTFSTYSESSSSRRRAKTLSSGNIGDSMACKSPQERQEVKSATPIGIKLGTLRAQLDVATAQLLYQIGSGAIPRAVDGPAGGRRPPQGLEQQEATTPMTFSIEALQVRLQERVTGSLVQPSLPHEAGLVGIDCRKLGFAQTESHTRIHIRASELSLGSSKLLAFDQDHRSTTSSVVFQEDVAINLDNSKTSLHGRSLTEIKVEARPIVLNIDLPAIDEALGNFGGLGSVLDIGSSILSDASPLASPIPTARPSKVRFQDEAAPTASTTELKANVRIGGATVHLHGQEAMIALKMSTIKSIYRENAATVTIGSVLLSGPYASSTDGTPATIDISTLRVDYLFTPQEQDFERLLALLIPSKDKYDNDEDILIDTLLRQRRKGACLRATVDDVKARVTSWECLNTLESLASEVGRFAAVTKYLPEDDRPGLLSMVRVKGFEAQCPVNDRFGTLRASLEDFQCAHVGLPALLALSMSDVRLSRLDGIELIHPLIPLSGIDNLPLVMARMLGDEAEPTIKVKLYNVCVEYSVSALLELTGMDKLADAEEIVAGLAASVADVALQVPSTVYPKRIDSEKSGSSKKTDLQVLLHNSALGLTPQTGQSKGLVILTDARFSSMVPPDDTMNAKLELRQAGIVITDDVQSSSEDFSTVRRNPPENTKVDTRLLNALWRQGYASVGSIMHAVVDVRVEKQPHSSESNVEVDVRSEFFLLETCADSTQTLMSIMNGLAPPTRPSKQPKYLTEPMSLDDMISSFTGDAYAQPEPARPSETLFDVEEEPEPDVESMLGSAMLEGAGDDLLAESEMTSSLYGPTSGIIGDIDDDQEDERDFGEAVESLLEDDPFEMTDSPDDMPFNDATLLRDLRQQSVPAASDATVDLGNYEIEDLGFDALGADQHALGSSNRFNTPISKRQVCKAANKAKLPFKLNLRDVNVAWHLHDGYDWQKTRDGLTAAIEQVERRAEERLARRRQSRNEYEEEESTIGDCMFNSVYISIPTNVAEAQDIRRGINRQIDDLVSESESIPASGLSRPTAYSAGGRPIRNRHQRRLKLERSRHHKISFELKGVSADVLVFPPDSGEVESSIDVRLKQFEIVDLVPTSTWKKFLTSMPGEAGTREMSKPMIHLEMLNVKTIADHAATEIILHVAVEPLRLHVDQDALDFITRFFEFKDSSAPAAPPPSEQPFLQRVEVETVDMQLDYKPKKVDYVGLRSGHTGEFMNFVILDQCNIRLRHAIIYGLHGFEPLHKTLNDIWAPDVKRNQLPTVLAGLAPVRSLVNIGTGVRDVVAIPVREYKKDGRIVRSIQKGAFQFGKTTASELARLGAKVAIGTQNLLTGAEGMLSPSAASPSRHHLSSSPDWADDTPEAEEREQRAFSAYADQPLGVFAGLRSARRHLEHDLLTARDAFIAVQGEVLESGGPGSAAAAVARHAPTVILRPVIGASRAVGTALLGVGNQIDRGGVRRMEDKYKRR